MKKQVLVVILVAALAACKEEVPVNEFALSSFVFSGCNYEKQMAVYGQQSVEYRYAEENRLFLKHNDVYFNCCQSENNLQVDSRLVGDSIIVSEYEKVPGMCKCICPYDMECTVGPLQEKQYSVIVKTGEIESFSFRIDFDKELDGVKSL